MLLAICFYLFKKIHNFSFLYFHLKNRILTITEVVLLVYKNLIVIGKKLEDLEKFSTKSVIDPYYFFPTILIFLVLTSNKCANVKQSKPVFANNNMNLTY